MKSSLRETEREFREVHHMHRRLVEKRVEQTGVFRSQHMTLMYISSHEGCSQKEIADAYQISGAAVAVNLKKLEKMGLVERVCDTHDSRCIFEMIDNRMFSTLTPDELAVFRRCLDKIRDQLIEMIDEADAGEST